MKELKLTPYTLMLSLLLCIIPITQVISQSPQSFNYQAVARNNAGAGITNQNIRIRFSITNGNGGALLYQETHSVSTNQFGLFTLNVGNGTPEAGTFATIPWGSVNAWLNVEMDQTGGTSFVQMGSSQLLSVPYALYAANGTFPAGNAAGNTAFWNGSAWTPNSNLYNNGSNIGINNSSPQGKLHITGTVDAPTLIIDANSVQSNTNPLIKLRNTIGEDLLWVHSDHPHNTFIGTNTGNSNDAAGGGRYSTFIGRDAGSANTTGSYNTAIGGQTLTNNTNGIMNTALGGLALFKNTSGSKNTAIGFTSMEKNTTGDYNTAIGESALFANMSGTNNTASGRFALKLNLTGSNNSAHGVNALYYNSTGEHNSALGLDAAGFNTTGSQNTAIGSNALAANVAGSNATAVGYGAMAYANSTTTPFTNENVAVGFEALRGSIHSAQNTGNQNTSFGYRTLYNNTTGNVNAASGYLALHYNTTGDQNTAHGSGALLSSTTGSRNTGVGGNALTTNATGNNNTALGVSAYFVPAGLDNTTAIGYYSGANVNASNRIEIGNTSVSFIGGQVGWSTYSDARIKDNVTANVPGLDFINRLRPVTYNLNVHRQNEMVYDEKEEYADWASKYDIEETRMTGFIAQEVAEAAKLSGYDFSGVQVPDNPDELLSIRYSDFVMPLVKSVQEINAQLLSTIEELTARIGRLEQLLQEKND